MAKLDELVVQVKADTSHLKKSISKSQKQMKTFGKKTETSFAGVGQAVSKLKTLFVAFASVMVFRAIAKDILDFGKAVGEVSTLIDSAKVSTEALGHTVKTLSVQFGTEFTTQATAMYQAISSGAVGATNATELLTAANKLAVGGVTSVSIAVDGLTNIINSFKMQASDSTAIADIFFSTVKDAKTTVGELATAMGQVTPIAASVGVSFNEVAAAVGTITLAGVSTSEAVTQLKGALVAVAKATPMASKLAKQLGIEWNVASLQAKGLKGFFDDLATSTGGNIEMITKLMGRVEGLQAVLNLTGKNSAVFARLLRNNANSAGFADAAFEKMAQTLSFKLNVAMAELRSLGLTLAPVVSGLISVFSGLLKVINSVVGVFGKLNFITKRSALLSKLQKEENLTLSEAMSKAKDIIALASNNNIRLEQALDLVTKAMKLAKDTGLSYSNALKQITESVDGLLAAQRKLKKEGIEKVFQKKDVQALNLQIHKLIANSSKVKKSFVAWAGAGERLSKTVNIAESLTEATKKMKPVAEALGLKPKEAADLFAEALKQGKLQAVHFLQAMKELHKEMVDDKALKAIKERYGVRTEEIIQLRETEKLVRKIVEAREEGKEIPATQRMLDLQKELIAKRKELAAIPPVSERPEEVEIKRKALNVRIDEIKFIVALNKKTKEKNIVGADDIKIINAAITATQTATEKAKAHIKIFDKALASLRKTITAKRKDLEITKAQIKLQEERKKKYPKYDKEINDLKALRAKKKDLIDTEKKYRDLNEKATKSRILMGKKLNQIKGKELVLNRAALDEAKARQFEILGRRQMEEIARTFLEVKPFEAMRQGFRDTIEDFDNTANTMYKIAQESTMQLRDTLAESFKIIGRGGNVRSAWAKLWADLNNIAYDYMMKLLASKILGALYKGLQDLFGLNKKKNDKVLEQGKKQVEMHAKITVAATIAHNIKKKHLETEINLLKEQNRLLHDQLMAMSDLGGAAMNLTSSFGALSGSLGGAGAMGGYSLGGLGGGGLGGSWGSLGSSLIDKATSKFTSGLKDSFGSWASGDIGLGDMFTNVGTLFGGFFQKGGKLNRGEAGWVGEEGPEMFVPKTSGTIVPMQKGSQGPGLTVVNNMNFALGVQQTVRAEILMAMPQIQRSTELGVFNAIGRGGKFAKAVGRKG